DRRTASGRAAAEINIADPRDPARRGPHSPIPDSEMNAVHSPQNGGSEECDADRSLTESSPDTADDLVCYISAPPRDPAAEQFVGAVLRALAPTGGRLAERYVRP